MQVLTCECGDRIADPAPDTVLCEGCEWRAQQPPHVGHFSRLGGIWWCDTCNSPYCELA